MNLAAHLESLAVASGWSSRPAVLTATRTWTHGEIHDAAARAASVLAVAGIGPGDRVLLALPDGPGWFVAFLATARLGAVAVLVNPELPAHDHALLAARSRAALAVTGVELADRFDNGLDVDRLLALTGSASPRAAHPVAPDATLYVQYTSGTTGEPKAVPHAHRDPGVYAAAVGRRVLGVGPVDVALSVSRLFFAYGFGNAFAFPLFTGSAAVLTPARPGPDDVPGLLERHRVSLLYAVPSAFAALPGGAVGPHLRAAVSAGETLPVAVGTRVRESLGVPVLEQIGSTEAGHAFCANGVAHDEPGTVGRPVPGYAVELRDRGGTPVADGDEGTLWVRGPTLTAGYLDRPADTAAVLVDGWLDTRDRAVRLPSGAYRHTGRSDDMEMVGGITVAPQEIERVLVEHPLVREAAVAAVPDATGTGRLQAFVVAAGADPAALEADLLAMTRRRLAAFKVPCAVHAVTELPRTATGKLRRHQVRRGAW